MIALPYYDVHMFNCSAGSGKRLTIFPHACNLSQWQMLTIAQEMRHCESVFICQGREGFVKARVFDRLDERDCDGYPLIAAASVLHWLQEGADTKAWFFEANSRVAIVTTSRAGEEVGAVLDHGAPQFAGNLSISLSQMLAEVLDIRFSDFAVPYPPEVVSVGEQYLILPIESGLERVNIRESEVANLLASVGADHLYVFDVRALEGRHWSRRGTEEHIAEYSGASAAAAYAVRHGRLASNECCAMTEGRLRGVPCEVRIWCNGSSDQIEYVLAASDVALAGTGIKSIAPESAA